MSFNWRMAKLSPGSPARLALGASTKTKKLTTSDSKGRRLKMLKKFDVFTLLRSNKIAPKIVPEQNQKL